MRFEMIENFSVTFSSLKFSFCMASIISAPTPFKRLCNFALYFLSRKNAVGTTKNFYPPLIQRKKSYGLQLKKLSPHFSCRKIGGSNTLKIENLQNVQNPEGYPQKRKQAKDGEILCLLQYIFSKQKQNRAIPFPIILLCYGSNSGAGSYTSIISRDANRNPFVNACSSFRS